MQHAVPANPEHSSVFILNDLPDPEFDENALVVLRNRYLIKSEDGTIIETPKELLWRVAVFIASAEALYFDEVYSKDGGEIVDENYGPDAYITSGELLNVLDRDGVEDLVGLQATYRITDDTIGSLYRAWYFYRRMGRMKVGFRDFMIIFVENFGTKIFPVADEYYRMMADLRFLPNTPTLMNAGLSKPLLSGCFVLPIEDDLVSILDTSKHAALVHKAGGGTGFAFSRLRPRGDSVGGRPDGASGPVSFMKVFNATTGEIKQGFSRRGANMGVLDVHHPDIMEFIDCKIPPKGAVYTSPDDVPFSNFNISVAVTDEFMKAVKSGANYRVINPRTGKTVEMADARGVWKNIIHNAWKNGDPGVVFIDEMNRHNPTPDLGDYESTNPCGEQILLPNESCNLGAINLNKMLDGDSNIKPVTFRHTVDHAVRFLNGVVDMNWFPLDEIYEATKKNRKIGLGIMGFADALYAMKIPYDSQDAMAEGKKISKMLTELAGARSRVLARKRGPFINVDKSIYKSAKYPPFNAALTTIAPTGTTGIIANSASGGIEPVTYLKFSRRTFEGDILEGMNQVFLLTLKVEGLENKKVLDHVAEHGTISNMDPKEFYSGNDVNKFKFLQSVFKVAHDIPYHAHVGMQAAFQSHIDSSISKTINFPEGATEDEVASAYMLAYELKCKGITIYRDGSKGWQIIKVTNSGSEDEAIGPSDLPDNLPARRFNVETGCGVVRIIVSYDPKTKKPLEVFIEMGKSGGCAYAWAHGIGRLISNQLRSGLPVDGVISQLKNIQCLNPLSRAVSRKNEKVSSCLDAIAIALRDFSNGISGTNNNIKFKDRETRKECPKCGSGHLVYSEGCVTCHSCDWSKCDEGKGRTDDHGL